MKIQLRQYITDKTRTACSKSIEQQQAEKSHFN